MMVENFFFLFGGIVIGWIGSELINNGVKE